MVTRARRRPAWVVVLLALLLLAGRAPAGGGRPEWGEVEVDLGRNGRSSVQYAVCYRVISGEFHGFYFTGPQIDDLDPVWDDAFAAATTEDGRRLPVVRAERGGRKAMELGGGAGVTSG